MIKAFIAQHKVVRQEFVKSNITHEIKCAHIFCQ